MKRLFYIVVSLCLLIGGCQEFDDSAIWEDINSLKERVETLETLCRNMNKDITALKALVKAVETRDYITDVAPITGTDGVVTGYTISFANSDPITINHGMDGDNGQDGQDGQDGEDAVTPIIGVRQDTDGVYYWTLNGDWLLDDEGNRIKASGEDGEDGKDGQDGTDGNPGEDGSDGENGADGKDGVTPQLKIEEGIWYVSYDNGGSWHEVGPATGEQGPQGPQGPQGDKGERGDSIFESIDYTSSDDYVIFTLADGTSLVVRRTTPDPVVVTLGEVGDTDVTFNGIIHKMSLDLKVTIYYGVSSNLSVYKYDGRTSKVEFEGDSFTVDLTNLATETKYYYFVETIYNGTTTYSAVSSFVTIKDVYAGAINLSETGTANSYIVSSSGAYCISPVKGNSSESVGDVSSVEVLWETFGTDEAPSVGDLIKSIKYKNGKIYFKTPETYREGNAVIAAKDASGTILWSWHIWMTDQPEEQVYYNHAGTVMDRNLGATSATPGDVGALGLLYQWGRKDPFLGSSSISENEDAISTISWPDYVRSTAETGTIEYAQANPTTFIYRNSGNDDWFYSGDYTDDYTRWTPLEMPKSLYDPCPVGWRIPNGGDDNFCSTALNAWLMPTLDHTFDTTNKGMNLSGKLGPSSNIWYPATGRRQYLYKQRGVVEVGVDGHYWTTHCEEKNRNKIQITSEGIVYLRGWTASYLGCPVRCVKEGTVGAFDIIENSGISVSDAISLSYEGTANSYIVSDKGTYSFPAVKGNSSESVGSVASVEVLWETFGTDVTPSVGELIHAAIYKDDKVYFKTADTYREGNAVIAAKDATGTILWSWHIWMTDQPAEQVYYNNAGTMMDRNLGATSATPGDVGALGLLYQWGRKDPFLGSSNISSSILAKSTLDWPSNVASDSYNGTIEYATTHPTTFIVRNQSNYDWYYTGDSSTDNTRWTESDNIKSIYDPCPAGWRVPDGGDDGVWAKAMADSFSFGGGYDSTNEGMNFSGCMGSDASIWYSASGYRDNMDGCHCRAGNYGYYWSSSFVDNDAYGLLLDYFNNSHKLQSFDRAYGYSVRCIKEGTGGGSLDFGISTSTAVSLSTDGTANSYIVSENGTYSFPSVKGNSSESVGSVAYVEVLWETFGTDVTPSVGDLIPAVIYEDGTIYFKTADTYREGNAVIAARDSSRNILWSWHIWLTDKPQEQVYNNNAGTMMDRNLGATSATPGDVGALGLLYQWGRKDPFIGSSSISSNALAMSTIMWTSYVESDPSTGTIEYAIAHPTTFILSVWGSLNDDWFYTGDSSSDQTRWTESDKVKSIYDPCPAGWRVPDGGRDGFWVKAGFGDTQYDSINNGISFSISSPSNTWYPATGFRQCRWPGLHYVGGRGRYWSASPRHSYDDNDASYLEFASNGRVYILTSSEIGSSARACGYSVRCCRE